MKNNEIIILTDYKGVFGSKYYDTPYRSGLDKDKIRNGFNLYGFNVNYVKMNEINISMVKNDNKFILYTSSEDKGYHYKSYIEDIILGCVINGANVIPGYKFLRANNNKVFMEVLRGSYDFIKINNLQSFHFGCLEEAKSSSILKDFKYPVVIKLAEGATSKNVFIAKNYDSMLKIIKSKCRTRYSIFEIWDFGRSLKHKGYLTESMYRKKFIVQEFIPNLKHDWKVLIYFDKYYVLKRFIRRNDFRASGSGNFIMDNDPPKELLLFCKNVIENMNVPQLSLDVAGYNNNFYLLEFQALYFGTYTQEIADYYYIITKDGDINKIYSKTEIESIYVESIVKYIKYNYKI